MRLGRGRARARDAGVRRRRRARACSSARCGATRRSRTRAACSRSCAGTSPATRPRWSSASAASPRRTSVEVAEALIENSGRERTTAFCYAVGWTQHTAGVQMIRAAAILQLLLGNIGRPGRRRSSRCAATRRSRARPTSRRSTTCSRATCRCRAPARRSSTSSATSRAAAPTGGWWSFFDNYIVSLLKAWFGDAATRGERLRLLGHPADQRQPLAFRDDAAHARRRGGGLLRDGPEPGRRLAARRPAAPRAGAGSSGWSSATWPRSRRRRFWRDSPGGAIRRAAAGGDRDRGVSHARRGARREGGLLHQHPAPGPVPRQGARAAGRRALGAVVHAPPGQAREGALRRLAASSATGRSSTCAGTTPSTGARASPTSRRC